MVSKKSLMFQRWLEGRDVNDLELVIRLEQAARLIGHSVDLMGEPTGQQLHELIRVSKLLQEEYEQS